MDATCGSGKERKRCIVMEWLGRKSKPEEQRREIQTDRLIILDRENELLLSLEANGGKYRSGSLAKD